MLMLIDIDAEEYYRIIGSSAYPIVCASELMCVTEQSKATPPGKERRTP